MALQQSADGPVIELDTDEPDDPPVTLAPPQLTVIEPDTDDPDDPLVALQQSDGSVSEPANGDLPADTTTTGVLIVDGQRRDRPTHRQRDRTETSTATATDITSSILTYTPPRTSTGTPSTSKPTPSYQFDVKHNGGNLPVYRLKIYDSARQVAADNNFGVPSSWPDQRNALPFQPDTAGRYYVSIAAPKGGIAPNRVYTLSVQSDDYASGTSTTAVVAVGGSIRTYIMRTETNAGITSTRDFDTIKVALQANTPVSDRVGRGLPPRRHHPRHRTTTIAPGCSKRQLSAKRTVIAPTSPSNSHRPSAGTTSLPSAPEGPTSPRTAPPTRTATRSRASGAPSRSSASPSRRTTLRSPRGATRRRAQGGRDPVGAGNSAVVVDLPRCGPMLSPRVPNLVPIPGPRMERETPGQRPRSNYGHPRVS